MLKVLSPLQHASNAEGKSKNLKHMMLVFFLVGSTLRTGWNVPHAAVDDSMSSISIQFNQSMTQEATNREKKEATRKRTMTRKLEGNQPGHAVAPAGLAAF